MAGVTSETGLTTFEQNTDFFAYTVPDGGSLDVLLTFLNVNGDIDFALRDADGNSLLTGATSSDNESGTWSNNTGADVEVTLEVFIWAFNAATCSSYDIDVTVNQPVP